jgi:hypothetical protein
MGTHLLLLLSNHPSLLDGCLARSDSSPLHFAFSHKNSYHVHGSIPRKTGAKVPMKTRNRPVFSPWFPIFLFLLTVSACCPSGIWLDNFGNQYQILTFPSSVPDTARETSGSVDTLGWGCGIWNIRPLNPGEPYDPANAIAFVAENLQPTPYDNCCYAFRFEGNETNLGCVALSGQYQTVGGKCNQSGSMVIEVYR